MFRPFVKKPTPSDIGAAKAIDPLAAVTTGFTAPALNTPLQNLTGKSIWMSIRGAVVSAPQQNGHMYLEISQDNVNWVPWDYIACRNNQNYSTTGQGTVVSGGPNIGCGAGLQALVPAGWWYRVRTETQTNYAAPSYLYQSSAAYFFGMGNST